MTPSTLSTEEYIARVVAEAPPLPPAVLDKIADLLRATPLAHDDKDVA